MTDRRLQAGAVAIPAVAAAAMYANSLRDAARRQRELQDTLRRRLAAPKDMGEPSPAAPSRTVQETR